METNWREVAAGLPEVDDKVAVQVPSPAILKMY